MKLLRLFFLSAFTVFLVTSCTDKKPRIDSETYFVYLEKGGDITQIAQATLLMNVGKAIQKGGPEHAIEFCNLKASSILDSLNWVNNCTTLRVSIKNRNSENGLEGNQDKKLWELFLGEEVADTIIQTSTKLVYYKPIKIKLPACLKCHGKVGADINAATHHKLQELYPHDLATGYKMNDFRGMWKVGFDINP